MKKLFCITMSIMLIISLCACNSEPSESDISQTSAPQTDSVSSDIEQEISQYDINFPSYEELAKEYPDKTVLVWSIPKTFYDAIMPFRTREINEYLDMKGCDFAVCFEPIKYDAAQSYPDSYVNAITEYKNSGKRLDIISAMNYGELVYNGLYTPLDEYLKNENGEVLYSSVPEKLWESLRINGSIYGVNATSLYTLSLDNGYFVNKELCDKYGYDIKKPITEQTDILKKVRENEKNVDVFSTYLQTNIVHCTDVKVIAPGVYLDEVTHTAKCVLDNEDYINTLKLYNTLYELKLLNDMGVSQKEGFFIMRSNVAGGSHYDGEIKVDYNGKEITAYPLFPDNSSIRNCLVSTGICSFSENKDKAFQLLSLAFSDKELNNLLAFGAEGEDYRIENNTVDTVNNPFNTIRFANDFLCYRYEDTPFSAEEYIRIYDNAFLHEYSDFVFNTEGLSKELNAINGIMNDLNIKKGEDISFDEYISQVRERLNKAGIDKVIDECNRQIKEYADEKD